MFLYFSAFQRESINDICRLDSEKKVWLNNKKKYMESWIVKYEGWTGIMINSGGDGGGDLHSSPVVEEKHRQVVAVVVGSRFVERRLVERRLVERKL